MILRRVDKSWVTGEIVNVQRWIKRERNGDKIYKFVRIKENNSVVNSKILLYFHLY